MSKDDGGVLNYSGGGRISVPVSRIVNSKKVQRQVAAVKKIAAMLAARTKGPSND